MKRIGIAGATGLVGETLIRILESGKREVEELRLFASGRSAGEDPGTAACGGVNGRCPKVCVR